MRPTAAADSTAVRVALWRALHVEVDRPPHVFEDEIGLKLAAPEDGWRDRPDMSAFTRPFRASIVARARFIEDLVTEQTDRGIGQYVILGAGLDTFAQRRPEVTSRLLVFEVDRPGPQMWKRQRLIDLGFGIPSYLRLVPVDFEGGETWWERRTEAGFDANRPAVIASTGVSMYLTKDAIEAILRQIAALAPNSTLAMSFMLPIEMADPGFRPLIQRAAEGAQANGTPFIVFSCRRRCSRWRGKPVFEMSGTYQRKVLPNATSPAGPMVFVLPTIRRSCCSRRHSRRQRRATISCRPESPRRGSSSRRPRSHSCDSRPGSLR